MTTDPNRTTAREGQLIRRHERGDPTRWSYVAPARARALLGDNYIHVLRYLAAEEGVEAVVGDWVYRWRWAPDEKPAPILRLVGREDIPVEPAVEALPALAIGDEVAV